MKLYEMPEEGYIDQDNWPSGQYVRFEEIKKLIVSLGERADICVYHDLKQICDYCQCKRKKNVMPRSLGEKIGPCLCCVNK